MFERIAVVNRGEPAMRFIHAVHDLDASDGPRPQVVAVHVAAERSAMFVRAADDAICIQSDRGIAYLDYDELGRALRLASVDAAWVGWGFVAEQPAFVDLCDSLGVTFIGPPAAAMRKLGDKIAAKRLAEEAGLPVAPWSGGPVASVEEALSHAERIGFPLMVKAVAGGGGRGIRMVRDPGALPEAFASATNEARLAFGDPTVLIERVIEHARHVEVQVVADNYGTVWTPGVRDCSIQRRHQKVLEESASSALSPELAAKAASAAARLVKLAGYRSAGTVELLFDPTHEQLAFLEVNTRLQVEHPVTELVTGLDLVKLQLHVAGGGRLEGEAPEARGHAIEVRLNAEDPEAGFAPAPGTVAYLRWPTGPGVRIDTGIAPGDEIPGEFDSMIAKICVWGADRAQALTRLRRAIDDTTVLVRGGMTNKAFLRELVAHEDVVHGDVHTRWLDEATTAGEFDVGRHGELALCAAAIDAYEAAAVQERAAFYAAARIGRPPQVPGRIGHSAVLRTRQVDGEVRVRKIGRERYRLDDGASPIEVVVEQLDGDRWDLVDGERRHAVVLVREEAATLIDVDGVVHRVARGAGSALPAPASGVVVGVHVAPGDLLAPGQAVATIEAMKMEVVVRSEEECRVAEVLCVANMKVDTGAPLVRLEPVRVEGGDGTARSAVARWVELAEQASEPPSTQRRAEEAIARLLALVLGYDLDSEDVHDVADLLDALGPSTSPSTVRSVLEPALDVLRAFADLCSLGRNRRVGDEAEPAEAHNQREYLHAYLQTLDVEQAGVPEGFAEKVLRALSWYGISSLERTTGLEESLHRIYGAQQHADAQLSGVSAILRWCLAVPMAASGVAEELFAVLDQLIVATQLRYPSIGTLARSVRFAHVDQPLITARRREVMATMRGELGALAAEQPGSRRDEHLARLVECPLPLIDLMAELDPGTAQDQRDWLIEVLARRYYQIRHDPSIDRASWRGRQVTVVSHGQEVDRAVTVAAEISFAELLGDDRGGALRGLIDLTGATSADLYVAWDQPQAEADELARRLAAVLGAHLSASVQRVTVTATSPGRALAGIQRFTFEREPIGYEENRALRNLHPLIAQRLHLGRLANFHLRRLASADHVYLFHCVGRMTRADERLVALAEVRDLVAIFDSTGAVAAVPELEHVFASCLDAMRRALADWPGRRRPQWNRVLLYAWPVIDLPLDELQSLVGRLAPMTEGLDLEQVVLQGRIGDGAGGVREVAVRVARPGRRIEIQVTDPPTAPLRPMDEYDLKVLRAHQRGAAYPYEIAQVLARAPGPGSFVELDLNRAGDLEPVQRPPGSNTAGIVVGTVTTPLPGYPEGVTRVVLLGDPTKALGTVAEAECLRIEAAVALAARRGAPLEWFALSSGVTIAMDSGTESMDLAARVLRRIVEHTQAGGEINIVVAGINVGAQAYWNAEATMLMHTKGILVMTPDSAMVLTGKQALEYSGGVAAEDNFGIGGYDRVMGPNGQAQYWAPDLMAAISLLVRHYELTYVAPGERAARRLPTTDPVDRDIRSYPHRIDLEPGLDTVGAIFSEETNPGRKKPFDIRSVMRAVVDQDHPTLERWPEMHGAETAVVLDARIGGHALCLLGFESHPIARRGPIPADGPDRWSAGTLFPRSSAKVARAVNAASGRRPLVVLANLSGFDGSPESLRELQLEYGAEIGRAVVNFRGPIVFCVISRYHGGAFVVFSKALHDEMEVVALEGSYASVIGGAPAAAVVFIGEVNARAQGDPRIVALDARIAEVGDEASAAVLRAERAELYKKLRAEKQGEIAAEYDAIHSIARAQRVGSVDSIIAAERLRPHLVAALARGLEGAASTR